jgi:hypothetical protein
MALPRPAEGSAGVERLEKLKGALPHGVCRASHNLSVLRGQWANPLGAIPIPDD